MSELTVTLLRFGFLALLWIFIFAVIASQARDLAVGNRARAAINNARKKRPAAREERPATPPAGKDSGASTTGGTRYRPRTLVIVDGPLSGSSFQLGSAPILLGRSAESTVPLEDDYASGRHARLFAQGSRWFLEDLGSTNGTFLQGQQLSRATAVDPGVQFRVGRTVMELRP